MTAAPQVPQPSRLLSPPIGTPASRSQRALRKASHLLALAEAPPPHAHCGSACCASGCARPAWLPRTGGAARGAWGSEPPWRRRRRAPADRWCGPGRVGQRAALEEAQAEPEAAAARPEAREDDEDEEEALPHSEAVDVFQEGLAMVVQDPLLCDLPIQVTLEEVNSQIALEYGQAMTVRVCKMDGEVMPVVVVQNATVLDLKKAIQRYVQLRQEREGGIQHISWSYVWRTYHLTSAGEKLTDDRKKLRDYGIRNRDEVSFIKKLRQK
ncbi:U11/U12 small nuclear ribonucleoprotein 25 kDa protein [Myotis lucifugus]|nr:U11/U12 small nuclear ribonucleoprotein 25 kDa protein [Myotis lucifugus]